jgi:two-component system response regulator PilR (NtrC family)
MRQVRSLIGKVSRSMAPVMICGESGTGKELVARAIHQAGERSEGPFIAVNCGAIPEALLEAEFFGYRKGSFTGAAEDREGFFQAARGGTLFLDEIGDLPLAMQSKLLRVVQERAVRPVGAMAEQPTDVRLLSATHKDLAAEVLAGRFRQDLYYRLHVIEIRVPALRERREDLQSLCGSILDRLAAEMRSRVRYVLSAEALDLLRVQHFPGNVRELENLLHRAVALSSGEVITAEDLGLEPQQPPRVLAAAAAAALPVEPEPLPADLAGHLDEVERSILLRALERHRFNRTAAGASMGLTLRQMRYRMARLGIQLDGEAADEISAAGRADGAGSA